MKWPVQGEPIAAKTEHQNPKRLGFWRKKADVPQDAPFVNV